MPPLFGKEGLGEILKYVFLPMNSLVYRVFLNIGIKPLPLDAALHTPL